MINPISNSGHKWILMATNYFTRWTEATPLKNVIEAEIVNFLEEMVERFGSPKTIISNNAQAFVGSGMSEFSLKHGVYLKTSSNYYLQGNGLTKCTNKSLIRLIKHIGLKHQKEWHKNLQVALWVDHITPKKLLKASPYKLV